MSCKTSGKTWMRFLFDTGQWSLIISIGQSIWCPWVVRAIKWAIKWATLCVWMYIYIQLSIHILYIHIYTYIYHAMYLYTHPCTIGDVAWCCHIGWQVFFGTDLRFFRAQKKHNSTRSLVRSGDYAWWQLGVSIVMGLPQNVKIPFFDGWLGVLPWLRRPPIGGFVLVFLDLLNMDWLIFPTDHPLLGESIGTILLSFWGVLDRQNQDTLVGTPHQHPFTICHTPWL